MSEKQHGTSSFYSSPEDYYMEFVKAVISQIPRPGNGPGRIDKTTALGWIANQETLRKELHGVILPPEKRIVKNKKLALFPGNEYLKFISEKEELIIDACNGGYVLRPGDDVFTDVDPDFENYNVDESSKSSSSEIEVGVYELIKDATFAEFFGSIATKTALIGINLEQIRKFVLKYKRWLRSDGRATFFLFQSRGNFFVAHVCLDVNDMPGVYVNLFGYNNIWNAKDRFHVILPKLLL